METARGSVEVRQPTKLEQANARRVAESKATIPHIYLDAELQVPAGVAPSELTARTVKAAAASLREHPRLNGAYRDGSFESYSRVNIGLAIPGKEGTVVPTLFDADTLEVSEIASALQELHAAAREGTLTSPQLAGGTFTIVSVAEHAVARLVPVIHAGQAAALGLGGISGAVVAHATLACDHRLVTADDAGAFLGRIRGHFEGA